MKLPRPVETVLPNGINVMILEDHRFPLVTVQFEINGAGPLFEPANQPGLAAATARMLTEGTKTRTSKDIADQIDSLGAKLSASAAFGSGYHNAGRIGIVGHFRTMVRAGQRCSPPSKFPRGRTRTVQGAEPSPLFCSSVRSRIFWPTRP